MTYYFNKQRKLKAWLFDEDTDEDTLHGQGSIVHVIGPVIVHASDLDIEVRLLEGHATQVRDTEQGQDTQADTDPGQLTGVGVHQQEEDHTS